MQMTANEKVNSVCTDIKDDKAKVAKSEMNERDNIIFDDKISIILDIHDFVSDSAHDGGRDVVVLNVGGTIHQVKWDTIDKFPNSRLQKLRYAASDCECSLTVSSCEGG